jgi:hypothetical protein
MLKLRKKGALGIVGAGLVLTAAGSWYSGMVLRAQAPAWWSQRSVLLAGAAPDDYAFLNQGQLKQFALAGLAELEERLPDGAGPELHALLNLWSRLDATGQRVPVASPLADDYAVVNIGQLKAVAMPFRQRLAEAGILLPDPFTNTAPEDYALANIGQAKQLFQVDLTGQKVEGLSATQDGATLTLTWSSSGSDDTYTVYGVDGYADRKSLVVLQADLTSGLASISNEIAARFENIAVQIRRKNVWGELKILWDATTNAGLLTDPIPADPEQDTDRDGVADRKDGWPEDPDLAPPKATRPSYAVLPLPDDVEWVALNEKASVAGNSQRGAEFWKKGGRTLIRENATVIAINDNDQVLIQYEREAAPDEYDLNVARAVSMNLEDPDQDSSEWYPDWYAKPQDGEFGQWPSPRVHVSGIWSPEGGLQELSQVREVAQGGRWPRWSNGSRLFTVSGRWLDNAGVVYGEARIALLMHPGSLDPIGTTASNGIGSGADQDSSQNQPWYEQARWLRGAAMNKWDVQTGGFVMPLTPNGQGIGPQTGRWFQSVSSTGQELVGCWDPTRGVTRFELNGQPVPGDGSFSQVHNAVTPGGSPILSESQGGWQEALWIYAGGEWVAKPVGQGSVCWAALGSLVSRIQRSDAVVPENRRLEVRAITDSGIALGTALHLDEQGELLEPLVYEQALFLPVAPSASEVYMFSGHDGDVVKLSAAAGSDLHCEWRLQDSGTQLGSFTAGDTSAWGSSAVGTTALFRAGREGSPDVSGHNRAQFPGRNSLELWVEGMRIWEKPIEVVGIKPRSAWGAEPAKVEKLEGMPAINCVTLHHTASNKFGSAEVLNIQKHHTAWGFYYLGGKSWGDIGYHFLLDPSDPDPQAPVSLYEGRPLEGLGLSGGPWTKASAVLMKNTAAGINVSMMGNYHTLEETFTALRAKRAEKVLSALFLRYALPGEMLRTHRGLASLEPVLEPTVCPGWQVFTHLTPNGMRKAVRDNLE